jgi:hypothetical protein
MSSPCFHFDKLSDACRYLGTIESLDEPFGFTQDKLSIIGQCRL